MKKATTLVDIANELNIDVSTVSKALKNHPKISDDTKKKVADVAKKLHYYPNNIATALINGTSHLIGVMIPQMDENFFSSTVRGIEEVAKENGYNIIIFQSHDRHSDEKKNIKIMLQARVDGILASHAMETNNFDHYQQILNQGIPLIFFDRFNESIDTDIVAVDDFQGAYKATGHLINQGCRHIAHIGGAQQVHIYKERFRGYKQALMDHNLPFKNNWIFESNLKQDEGQKYTEKLLTYDPIPDAIFTASDYSAVGALQVLKKHDIKVPDEVAVVGFSNEDFCSFITPTLTSVDQHSRSIGQSAAKLLLKHLKNNNDKEASKKKILKAELIIRNSSRRSE